MNQSDIKRLRWIYTRLAEAHKESRFSDYMTKFREIIDNEENDIDDGEFDEALNRAIKTDQPKRYRLEIPEVTTLLELFAFLENNPSIRCEWLSKYNGCEILEEFNSVLPESWLVEIEDEKPKSIKNVIDSNKWESLEKTSLIFF